jgi:hypothetical protein
VRRNLPVWLGSLRINSGSPRLPGLRAREGFLPIAVLIIPNGLVLLLGDPGFITGLTKPVGRGPAGGRPLFRDASSRKYGR